MKPSNLTAVLGFGCVLLLGCSQSPKPSDSAKKTSAAESEAELSKQRILRVLRADEKIAKERRNLPPGSTPSQVAWGIQQYCDDLAAVNMSDCPADFRVAYRHHIHAWRDTGEAMRALPDGFMEGLFMGAFNSLLRGELDGGADRLVGALKKAMERVRTTWEEVERIGARYGAAL